ncbi:unnamed protein product [Protopolystoma xenopodis]|uniref:Uncharacterized protein n=1 Tax=Protopolystoma xenopodis TaxID=117903 RepID=A0A448WC71_9PLAT|nr:unnamed protein product [Protopolystoma xenopodis]
MHDSLTMPTMIPAKRLGMYYVHGQTLESMLHTMDSGQGAFFYLLDRLSEVQEENCVFRRQIARLESELVEKRRTLQAILDGCLEVKPTSANSSHFQSSSSSSLLVSGTDDPIATSLPSSRTPYEITNNGPAIGSPSAAFRRLASVSKQLGPQIDAQNIQRLKQMCEELIARNLILEDLVRHFETRQSESTQHVTPHTGKLLI